MKDKTTRERVGELIKLIYSPSVPAQRKKKILKLVRSASEKLDQQKGNPEDTEKMFDELRVAIKYLLFDLEATKRENKYLEQLLNKERD